MFKIIYFSLARKGLVVLRLHANEVVRLYYYMGAYYAHSKTGQTRNFVSMLIGKIWDTFCSPKCEFVFQNIVPFKNFFTIYKKKPREFYICCFLSILEYCMLGDEIEEPYIKFHLPYTLYWRPLGFS